MALIEDEKIRYLTNSFRSSAIKAGSLIYKIGEEEHRFAQWEDFNSLEDATKSSLKRAVTALEEGKIVHCVLRRIYERDKNRLSFRAEYPGLVERDLEPVGYPSKQMFAMATDYIDAMAKLSKMDLDKLLKTGI